MKNSQILVLFLIGAVLTVIGAVFKISHERKDWTSFFLIIGMTFEAVAGIMLFPENYSRKTTIKILFWIVDPDNPKSKKGFIPNRMKPFLYDQIFF